MYLSDFNRHANSARSARRRMRYRGVTPSGQALWTHEEDEICRRHGSGDYLALQKRLPHRTYGALRYRCQMLGLRPKRSYLSAAELSKMRRLIPEASYEELGRAFPHRTPRNLITLARYHGIRRKRRSWKKTGYPIIDAIRDRCTDLNYTMVDLDKLARTGVYFQKGNWICNGLNFRAVGRAVAALDGELIVRWRDE
jgi:hypothetical protein